MAFELTLYVRAGCHLCEDMHDQLFELLEPGSFTVKTVDIDASEALREQYNELVPVLEHNHSEICHHFLDLKALRAALSGYNKGIGRN